MKRIYKSNEKVISGVCGGIGNYFGIDPVIIRILFIIFLITNWFIYPFIAYFVMASILPQETDIIDI